MLIDIMNIQIYLHLCVPVQGNFKNDTHNIDTELGAFDV